MRYLHNLAVSHIATGAALLGTGGGGDPAINLLIARKAIETYGPVKLIDVNELPLDAWVLPVGGVGAPTVGAEKLLSWTEIDESFAVSNAALPGGAYATMPIEIGGGNALLPFVLAMRHGLPVVDADTLGRAFPEMQMSSLALDKVPMRAFSLADEKGNTCLIKASNPSWMEALARPVIDAMGGAATACAYACTGEEVRTSALHGTVSLSERIGRALMDRDVNRGDPLAALIAETAAHVLLGAKVVELETKTDGGFVRGGVTLAGLGADNGRRVEVAFQNEYLLATEGTSLLATTPDLICILDRDTAMPISTENLRYGARVTLIAIACHPKWRSAAGIRATGPRYFGFGFDYVPVEKLIGSTL